MSAILEARCDTGSSEVQVGKESVQCEEMVVKICWLVRGEGSVISTKMSF